MTDNDWPYSVVDGIFYGESDPDLKAKGLKPGDDIRTAIGLDDHVVEFEITPNRPGLPVRDWACQGGRGDLWQGADPARPCGERRWTGQSF